MQFNENGKTVVGELPVFNIEQIDSDLGLIFDETARCPVILYENKDYSFEIKSETSIETKEILSFFELLDIRDSNTHFLLRFNSNNYVGIFNLSFLGIYTPIIEIKSNKIDYEEEYNKILLKISELDIDLITRANSFFEGTTGFGEELEEDENLLNSKLTLIRTIILSGKLESLYSYFLIKPFTRILPESQKCYSWEVDHIELDDYFNELCKNTFTTKSGKSFPLELENNFYIETINTVENQFLKYLLEYILRILLLTNYRVTESNTKLIKEGKLPLINLKVEIDESIKRCNKILAYPVFKNISKLTYFPGKSNVLQQKHPYRDLYRIYTLLFYSIKYEDHLLNELLRTSLKDLPKLYEYWCFLTIHDLMNNLFKDYDYKDTEFIKYNSTNFCYEINSDLACIFYSSPETEKIKKKVKLFYQKTYNSDMNIFHGRSYSHSLSPDISIELFIENYLVGIIHFDAKYKLDISRSYNFIDIDKMHTYKDAIMGSIGAYLLYPGNDTQKFIQEEKLRMPENGLFPSVGAFVLNSENESTAFDRLAISALIKSFVEIDCFLDSNGIFTEEAKEYKYLKRLID